MATLEQLSEGLESLNSSLSSLDTTLGNATNPNWGVGMLPGHEDINVGFTLTSGYLVFFMQAVSSEHLCSPQRVATCTQLFGLLRG